MIRLALGPGFGVQCWEGGGLETVAAATAKPPRGVGVRAHVCLGDEGGGEGHGRALVCSGPRDGLGENLLPRDRLAEAGECCFYSITGQHRF